MPIYFAALLVGVAVGVFIVALCVTGDDEMPDRKLLVIGVLIVLLLLVFGFSMIRATVDDEAIRPDARPIAKRATT